MPVLSPYASYRGLHGDDSLQYQTMMDASQLYTDQSWIAVDPALRNMPHYHFHLEHPKPMLSVQSDPPAYYSSTPGANVSLPCAASNQYYHFSQTYPAVFDDRVDVRYHSPASGPLGGSISDVSSEYTASQDTHMTRGNLSYVGSPTASFAFNPPAVHSPITEGNMWSMSPPDRASLTPTDDLVPSMNAVAMKELEVDSTCNPAWDQDYYGYVESATTIQPAVQLSPEELNLSDSVADHGLSSQTHTESSRTSDSSDEDTMVSPRESASDSEYCPAKRRVVAKHAVCNSATHSRSSRGVPSSRAVLSSSSRVQKQKTPIVSQAAAKEKTRFKIAGYRANANESCHAEKKTKSYPCPFHLFGCRSTFASKNEWKRHVSSQHLQLDFFRCDLGQCNPENNPKLYGPLEKKRRGGDMDGLATEDDLEVTYNDFNRKDLFTQHCRRMHGPLKYTEDVTTATNRRLQARAQQQTGHGKHKGKINITKEDEAAFEAELEVIRARCYIVRRKAPRRTHCGFCRRPFEAEAQGLPGEFDSEDDTGKAEERAWEERMEHVGRHYERDGFLPQDEAVDDDLVEWGLSVGVLQTVPDQYGFPRPWLADYNNHDLHKVDIKEEDVKSPMLKGSGGGCQSGTKRRGLRSRNGHVVNTKTATSKFARTDLDMSDSDDDDDDASAEDG